MLQKFKKNCPSNIRVCEQKIEENYQDDYRIGGQFDNRIDFLSMYEKLIWKMERTHGPVRFVCLLIPTSFSLILRLIRTTLHRPYCSNLPFSNTITSRSEYHTGSTGELIDRRRHHHTAFSPVAVLLTCSKLFKTCVN